MHFWCEEMLQQFLHLAEKLLWQFQMKTLAVHQLQREQSLYAVAGPGGTCPNSHPLSTCSKRSPCKVYFFFSPESLFSLSFYSFLPFSYCLSLAFRCTLAFVGLGFVSSLAPWQIQLSDNTIVWGPWVMASGVAGQQNGQSDRQSNRCVRYLSDNSISNKLNGHCPQSSVLSPQSLGRHTQTSH